MKRLLLIILFLLLCGSVFGAEIVRYVNTASSGGDGTTNLTTGATAAYASLFDWEAAEATDLVTDTNTMKVICSGTTDSTPFTITGWTTSNTYYITIVPADGTGAGDYATADNRHVGIWDTNKYHLSASGYAITCNENNVRFEGLQIQTSAQTGDNQGPILFASASVGENDCRVNGCILRGSNDDSLYRGTGINIDDADFNVLIQNTLIYDVTSDDTNNNSAAVRIVNGDVIVYNSTLISKNTGIRLIGGSCLVKNTIAQTSSAECFAPFIPFEAGSNYNLASDATAPGANSQQSKTLTFSGAGDYHLNATDTDAIDTGVDLELDSNWEATAVWGNSWIDYEGTDRDATPSIGSDEYSAGVTWTLTTSALTGGSVTVPGEGGFVYADESTPTITAVADSGYTFSEWTGTADDAGKIPSPTSASTTVTMDADYTAVANFTLDPTATLTQFGITWTFDELVASDTSEHYQYGTFANGDFWITKVGGGSVTIEGISPLSTDVAGRIKNGSMVNIDPGDPQGYDTLAVDYTPALNVALDVAPGSPLVLTAGQSLMSTISHDADVSNQLETAAVLTVLSSAPPEGSFRPPFCGTDKTINFNISDLDYSLLSSLTATASIPSLSSMEGNFERPWLDHKAVGGGRSIHPTLNMPDYAREMSEEIGDAALALQTDFTDEQKETLLIRFVQYGIDIYGVSQNPPVGTNGIWPGTAGQSSGRKWPILFAGIVLNDPDMKAIGAVSGDYAYSEPGFVAGDTLPVDYISFGEDDQTFYVSSDDIYSSPYELMFKKMGSGAGTGQEPDGSGPLANNFVKVTNGSTAVEGVGTSWLTTLSNVDPDAYLGLETADQLVLGVNTGFHIASIDSDTQITLTSVYTGVTDVSGTATYAISDLVYNGHGNFDLTKPIQDYEEYLSPTHAEMPEWSIVHLIDPVRDGLDWEDAAYRTDSTAIAWAGWTLSAHIMNSKVLWNHAVMFDYMDRYMEKIEADMFYTWDATSIGAGLPERQSSDFAEEMWDEYRDDYGLVWPQTPPITGNIIVNGNFNDDATGWTITSLGDPWTISGNELKYASVGSLGSNAYPTLTEALVAGTKYNLGFVTRDIVGGAEFNLLLGGSVVHSTTGSAESYTEGSYLEVTCGETPGDGFEVQYKTTIGASAALDDFVLLELGKTVPDVVGLTESNAETAITDEDLTVGTKTYTYSVTVAVDIVISQDPEAGAEAEAGDPVDIVVSLGEPPATIGGDSIYGPVNNVYGLEGIF